MKEKGEKNAMFPVFGLDSATMYSENRFSDVTGRI